MNRNSPNAVRLRRWLFAILKLLVLAAILWGVHRTVEIGLAKLREQPSPLSVQWPWLVAAGGLYLAGLAPCAVFWHRLLHVLGQEPRWGETFAAYYVGHLGKYVPGKAMVVILRTSLVHSTRVTATVAAASVFVESLTMMAVGAVIGGLLLAVRSQEHAFMAGAAVALAFAAALPTLPPVFARLAKLAGAKRADPNALDRLAQLDYATLLYGWAAMIVSWLLVGASLWATLVAAGYDQWPPTSADLLAAICAASLGVVAGFVSFIPGGALVREAVILGVLTPVVGEAGALVGAVLARLVWLAAELAASAALYGWSRATSAKAPTA